MFNITCNLKTSRGGHSASLTSLGENFDPCCKTSGDPHPVADKGSSASGESDGPGVVWDLGVCDGGCKSCVQKQMTKLGPERARK